MATVEFRGVAKVFPDGTRAVDGIDLAIADGEFMVLVGPSGCGKTTVLRMLAGLEEATHGAIRIGGERVNERDCGERDIAMVFQNYALYPHMTVAQNMDFPLRLAGIPRPERERRIRETARILGIEPYLGRKPGQLSGGQRQRVAMGRALVRKPQVFLMDEPLSNLDAKLRVQMRNEIAALQRDLGITTLYVTHDQIEAMTMGDRIAVMRGGRIQQVDTPQRLYEAPANLFVAAFIGTPPMNLVEARLERDAGAAWLVLAGQRLAVRTGEMPEAAAEAVVLGLRPEALALAAPGEAAARTLEARVTGLESIGSDLLATVALSGVPRLSPRLLDLAHVFEDRAEAEGLRAAREAQITLRLPPAAVLRRGEMIRVAVPPGAVRLFDAATGVALPPASAGAGRRGAASSPQCLSQPAEEGRP